MAFLEHYWKLKNGELNLDTRYNIFFAGASLHYLHDNDSWGLLPPEDSVNQYYNALKIVGFIAFAYPETFPIIPNGVFSYRLIPLKNSMRSICIARQENHPHDRPVATTDFKIHVHPFDELPELHSHLHPKFAIVELGRKLSTFNQATLEKLLVSHPILIRIIVIYKAWSSNPGENDDIQSNRFDRFDHGTGDGQSETSSKTGIDFKRATKRKRTNAAQTSPTPSGQVLGATRVAGLSHETLIDHEAVAGKEGWTQQSLLSWAESIAPRVEVRGASEGVIV
ncbi:hypothetical protein Agabi119p4_11588 [Agaricus bisporus var. burnettii]|uniref:HNH nuclease domain-containing protein n=1 Tax=Agaricus bisporus var. burnettii TaxID=192524 RepID=A0A8H7EUU0_AGABI|nr:hypothetical protein Agabi119p4_11588 [Agaricus bisporus var. burnettii]